MVDTVIVKYTEETFHTYNKILNYCTIMFCIFERLYSFILIKKYLLFMNSKHSRSVQCTYLYTYTKKYKSININEKLLSILFYFRSKENILSALSGNVYQNVSKPINVSIKSRLCLVLKDKSYYNL